MSLPSEYFEVLYEADGDPWGFATRWYEARKYTLTLAALPRAHYRCGFEPGCSIGILTAQLAERCDRLIASDPSRTALATAGKRVPGNVELVRAAVPHDWPRGTFDLIVCSELGYYLSGEDLDGLIARVTDSLDESGHLVAVHWRPKVAEYPQAGTTVHHCFAEAFRRLAHYEDEFVFLDVFGGEGSSLVPPE